MSLSSELKIVIISDATGETASLMTKAAILQFSDKEIHFTRYKNIRTSGQVEAIFQDTAVSHDLAVYTIVTPELRNFTQETATKYNLPAIDLLGPLMNGLSAFFDRQPREEPGLFRQVNEKYFERISAMEFTIHHDDGKNLHDLNKADIILVGISRTSKTPLSMYLSHHGWKVSNIPIIPDIPLPEELLKAEPNKIVALTIQAEVLHSIRRARLERLGSSKAAGVNNPEKYASLEQVVRDIEYATEIFRANKRWPVFDVSGKALEETAAEIIKIITTRKKLQERSL